MRAQSKNLDELREQIDSIDSKLVQLLNERARIAQQVGAAKQSGVKFSPTRETALIRRLYQQNTGPLPNAALAAVMREVISGCLGLEQALRVSYLGPAGTYSEEAVRARFGHAVTLMPCSSIDEAVVAAEKGNADIALVPVENTTEGSVGQTLDVLLSSPLTICDEVMLPIHHQLVGRMSSLKEVQSVSAHPQALAQCRTWLAQHLPHARQIPASSNGEAAQLAAKSKTQAAIAGKRAAELHELPILAKNIEDDPSNTTRFLVLGNIPTKPTGSDKTSLVCATPNTPGALLATLQAIAKECINMVKLESRPARSQAWEYVFYIDIEGHQEEPHVAQALRTLKKHAAFVKVLGSYPKAV
jgi:chorismate mutase/prephenate dehydratase